MSEKQNKENAKNTGVYKQAEYEKFAEFIALPKKLRRKEFGFDDQRSFADEYDVCETTLAAWKKQDEFWEKVNKKTKKWAKGRTPEVILGLYRNAKEEGRGADAKVWLEYIEDWKETLKHEHHSDELKEVANALKSLANNEQDTESS